MYLGAHGRANDLATLLDAMTVLQDRSGLPSIRCRLIGDGPEKHSLMACAESRGLDNIDFEPHVAKQNVPAVAVAVAAEADAFVICVRDLPALYRHGISMNKLCDYRGMGRPTVAAVNAINNPVSERDSGITVPARDPVRFADAISSLATCTAQERHAMGRRGRECVERALSCEVLAASLARVLDQALLAPTRASHASQKP